MFPFAEHGAALLRALPEDRSAVGPSPAQPRQDEMVAKVPIAIRSSAAAPSVKPRLVPLCPPAAALRSRLLSRAGLVTETLIIHTFL